MDRVLLGMIERQDQGIKSHELERVYNNVGSKCYIDTNTTDSCVPEADNLTVIPNYIVGPD